MNANADKSAANLRKSADELGVERRAAVCIGPEHGTVGSKLIKEAAKEAVRGVGFDVLLPICGFAFRPQRPPEEAKPKATAS